MKNIKPIKRLNRKVPKLSFGGAVSNIASMTAAGAPFGPPGIAIGAGIGVITSAVSEIGEAKAKKAMEEDQRRQQRIVQNIYNSARMESFDPNGRQLNTYNLSKGGTPRLAKTGGVADKKRKVRVHTPINNKPTPTIKDVPLVSNKSKTVAKTVPIIKKGSNNSTENIVDGVAKSIAYLPSKFNEGADLIGSMLYTGYSPFSKKHWNTIKDKAVDFAYTSPKKLDANYNVEGVVNNLNTAGLNYFGGRLAGAAIPKVMAGATPFVKRAANRLKNTKLGSAVDDVIKYNTPSPRVTVKEAINKARSGNVKTVIPNKGVKPISTKGTTISKPGKKPIDFYSSSSQIAPESRMLNPASNPTSYRPSKLHTRTIKETPVKQILQHEYGIKSNSRVINSMSDLFDDPVVGGKLRNYHGATNDYNMPYKDFMELLMKYPTMQKKVFKKAGINTKGLAKGGIPHLKKGGIAGVFTNASHKKIAPNAIQVKAKKKGTDTIKANLGGYPAMIDDKELVVNMSDGQPVVISHDRGEVSKYKQALKMGYNPKKLNDVFGMRAIAFQQHDTKLEEGGIAGYTFYNPFNKFPWQKDRPGGNITGDQLDARGKILTTTPTGLPIGYYTDEEYNKYFTSPTQQPNPVTAQSTTQSNQIARPTTGIQSSYKTYDVGKYNDVPEWKSQGKAVPKQTSTGLGLYGGVDPNDILKNGNPAILRAAFGDNIPETKDWNMNSTNTLTKYINNNYSDQLVGGVDNKYGLDYHYVLTGNKTGIDKPADNSNLLPSMTPKLITTTPVEKLTKRAFDPSTLLGGVPTTTIDPNAVLAGVQTLGNAISAIELNNQKLPDPVLNRFAPMDINMNRSLYEQNRSDIRGMAAGINSAIDRNSTSSNSMLARRGANQQAIMQGFGKIYGDQIRDRKSIAASNNQGFNQTAMSNNELRNNYNMAKFGMDRENIENRNKLLTSSIESTKGLFDDKKKTAMEREALQAIAASFGVDIDPNDTVEQIKKAINAKLPKQMGLTE